MTVQIRYNYLREEFISASQPYIDERILTFLKDHYVQKIDSNRKLSRIKDLKALLLILEKRDTLSYDNVEPLIYISTCLNNSLIREKIQDYQNYLQNIKESSLCDMYQNANASTESSEQHNETEVKNSASQLKGQSAKSEYESTSQSCRENRTISSKREEMLQQMVLSQISERIGRSWRDVARFLSIREYQIDIIQNKYPCDLKEQSYEALKLCISQYNTSEWKLNLLHALEKARRRDLKELAEKLLITQE